MNRSLLPVSQNMPFSQGNWGVFSSVGQFTKTIQGEDRIVTNVTVSPQDQCTSSSKIMVIPVSVCDCRAKQNEMRTNCRASDRYDFTIIASFGDCV
jgi:Tfp pilus assembly protein PilO